MKRILYLIILLPLLTGCATSGAVWSLFREVEDLQLVQTLGYDAEGGAVRLSISSGAGTAELPPLQLTATGRSIPDALESLAQWSAQEDLYFAHIRYVIAGERAAREGLQPLLDWLERSPQTRLDVPLFIAADGSAADCVLHTGDENGDITSALYALQRSAERQGSAVCFTAEDVAVRLSRSGAALCCAIRAEDTCGHKVGEDGQTVLCDGFALLTSKGLCCFTGAEAARGVCLLTGQAGSAVLTADTSKGSFSAELTGCDATLRPQWSEAGVPALSAELRCRAVITAGTALDRAEAETVLSSQIREAVEAALRLTRETGADLPELGCLLAREDPGRFAALDWPTALRTLPFAVDAQVTIEGGSDMEADDAL